jgi:Cys-rich repeat protein
MRVLVFVVVLLAVPGVAEAAVGDECADLSGNGMAVNGFCPPPEVCDPITLMCVSEATCSSSCTADSDCSCGLACDAGRGICVRPGFGDTCDDGAGHPVYSECPETGCDPMTLFCFTDVTPATCTTDSDCPADIPRCDLGAAVCVAADIPDGTVSIGYDCLADADCAAGAYCNALTGLCTAGSRGTTGPGCTADADCAADEHCDASGTCAAGAETVVRACASDADCAVNETCDSGGSGVCLALPTMACRGDMDCPAGELCDSGTGTCVPANGVRGTVVSGGSCLIDADCSAGDSCQAGECVAGPGGGGPLVPGTLAPRGCSAAGGMPDASWAGLLLLVGLWVISRHGRRCGRSGCRAQEATSAAARARSRAARRPARLVYRCATATRTGDRTSSLDNRRTTCSSPLHPGSPRVR